MSIKMARLPLTSRRRTSQLSYMYLIVIIVAFMMWQISAFAYLRSKIPRAPSNRKMGKKRRHWISRLTTHSDAYCISQLRMDRRTFGILCEMLRDVGGLKCTKNATLEEIVAEFVYTLAHHEKNRTIGVTFYRSGETISRHFHICLKAVLQLYDILLKKPEPIPDDCQDERWKYFKGCLGALDGTFISVTPPSKEKGRYRTRKGILATNMLGVCCPNMQFIYVLPGWEGSAHDGRVLRDAIHRPNGLKVPKGCYYLVDAGYCNAEGFLAPFRGQRYHLREFDSHRPETAEEYFNMKHSKARNVVERCFGLFKGRWKILASPSFFGIQTQVRIIIACCLLHNLIRKYMSYDPQELISCEEEEQSEDEESDDDEVEYITSIEPNDEWVSFRNSLATGMFGMFENRRRRANV